MKRNPDPKKWWDTVKQMTGCPKKKSFSSFVIGDQVVSGNILAEKINDAFVSITEDVPPLDPIFSTDSQLQNGCTPIPTEFVITEKDVYIINCQQYHLLKQQVPMIYRIGF